MEVAKDGEDCGFVEQWPALWIQWVSIPVPSSGTSRPTSAKSLLEAKAQVRVCELEITLCGFRSKCRVVFVQSLAQRSTPGMNHMPQAQRLDGALVLREVRRYLSMCSGRTNQLEGSLSLTRIVLARSLALLFCNESFSGWFKIRQYLSKAGFSCQVPCQWLNLEPCWSSRTCSSTHSPGEIATLAAHRGLRWMSPAPVTTPRSSGIQSLRYPGSGLQDPGSLNSGCGDCLCDTWK